MKYAFIGQHAKVWPVVVQCDVLEVSASGYRQHRVREKAGDGGKPGGRMGEMALTVHVKATFQEMKGPMAGRGSGASCGRAECGRARSAFAS